MKFIPIFAENLYSFLHHGKVSEFDWLRTSWRDIPTLEEFFENNKKDLSYFPYINGSIDKAIEKTINEADNIFDKLVKHARNNKGNELDHLFDPLVNGNYSHELLKKVKCSNSWLRIYAIQVEHTYIITGGAIKLTPKMQDREHTRIELQKIEICKNYLHSQDVFEHIHIVELTNTS